MYCPQCGAIAASGQNFCENDGARMVSDDSPAGVPASALPLDARPTELAARDRVEMAPAPDLAAVSDRGKRHPHNQDDIALGQSDNQKTRVLVVCDGVSSARYSARASRLAALSVCDSLLEDAATPDAAISDAARMKNAIAQANRQICALHDQTQGAPDPDSPAASDPPAATVVAVLLRERRLTVGWAGDSRAFWIDAAGARPLTRDHSWLQSALDGGMAPAEARRSPFYAAITRCLGPGEDATEDAAFEPDVRELELPPTAGRVLLCSDGLWRYAPETDEMFALVESLSPQPGAPQPGGAQSLCRQLVAFALARGARDNVSVALVELAAV